MAGLGRSLSLNTGSTLFGNTSSSQPQQPSGLFGSTTASSQPAQAGSLFGSSTTSQPQQAGGLFGNTAANTQTSKPGGFTLGVPPATQNAAAAAAAANSLFGAAPASTSSQPASGGLFGSTAAAASKPGGLFGSTATTSAPAAGGLFGGAATTPAAAPSGGLFGSTPAAASQPASTSLFGSSAAASKPAGLFGSTTAASTAAPGGLFGSTPASQPTTGGLFGSTTAAQPASAGLFGAKPAAGGLFGQTAAAPQPAQPAASSSLFGALNNANASAQPSQQIVAAVKVDWTNVKPTTRFNELHQEVQDAIVFIDEIVQGAIRASMQCSETIPALGHKVDGIPADVEYLERRLETVEGALGRDAVAVGGSKDIVEKDSEDAVRLFRAIENLKLPNQFHYPTIGGSGGGPTPDAGTTTDLLSYFSKRATELEQQAKTFERHQKEVDAHLRTVEHTAVEGMRKLGSRRNGTDVEIGEGLREVASVMRTFEEAILRVAERVGEGREKVVDLELGGSGR